MNKQVFSFLKENEGKDFRMMIGNRLKPGVIKDVYFDESILFLNDYEIDFNNYCVGIVDEFGGNIIVEKSLLCDNHSTMAKRIHLYIKQPSFLDEIKFNVEGNHSEIGFIEEKEFFSKIQDQIIYIKKEESNLHTKVDKLIGKDFEELVKALLYRLDNPYVNIFRHGDIVIIKAYGRRNNEEIKYEWVVR